jgi:hypothetical protein
LTLRGARPAVGSDRFKMENLVEVTDLHFYFANIVERDFDWDFG